MKSIDLAAIIERRVEHVNDSLWARAMERLRATADRSGSRYPRCAAAIAARQNQSAIARFDRAIRAEQSRGADRLAAVAQVAAAEPELHRKYLRATNQLR